MDKRNSTIMESSSRESATIVPSMVAELHIYVEIITKETKTGMTENPTSTESVTNVEKVPQGS